MSRETSAILRSVLLHIGKAKTVDEAYDSVKAMCEKDDIDAVEQALTKSKEKNNNA
ncbi:MAG: hypothetical protein FWH20_01500 [Oscillospiraceae bacterium]|nr:hypothetical protein [Oscillospiraceae bacterium]